MLVALFMGAINAYSWEQKEFMIGKLTMLQTDLVHGMFLSPATAI